MPQKHGEIDDWGDPSIECIVIYLISVPVIPAHAPQATLEYAEANRSPIRVFAPYAQSLRPQMPRPPRRIPERGQQGLLIEACS
jgi:hypothetical protein